MTSKATGVTRIDSSVTHGYQVRVNRNKKRYTKLFSDRKCGGKECAFEQAIAFRMKLEAEVDAMPLNAPWRLLRRHSKSGTTGVLGIRRNCRSNSRGIRTDDYVVSWSPEPGVRRTKSYSIKRYGENETFRMACRLRFEKMKEIHGDRYEVANYMELYRLKAAVDRKARSRK